jgi:CBS domain-containing protein
VGRVGEELATPVGALIARPPLTVAAEATVAEAARAMRAAGVSSALVEGDPTGILTDRDLRSRVLAEGLSAQTPVRAVMSAPLRALPADASVYGALLWMLEEGVHHLPLTRGGRIVGVVTDTDLLRHEARGPLALLHRIERLEQDGGGLAGYAGEVAATAETLFAGGLEVLQVARLIATLNDALTSRLLRRAERELGPPPCAYAWMALGSEGRMEQVLLSDQDNALAYAEPSADAQEYFARMAGLVVAKLIEAGFPPCPGGYMATRWCLPLEEWRRRFEGWLRLPEPEALLEAEVFLDFRPVAGALSPVELDALLVGGGAERALFLHQLARTALLFRPPLGAFGRFRSDDGAVDLKAGGIAATVIIARVYGLAAGSSRRATLERLEAAAAAGTLSAAGAEALSDTFRFLTRLRLREQLRSVRVGEPATNRVRLEALSPLERRRLREALRTVRTLQEHTARRFPG